MYLTFTGTMNIPYFQVDALKPLFTEAVQVTYSVDRYIVELPSGNAVAAFVPDTAVLRPYRCIITGKADEDTPYDFISRYFAGPIGVDEDPVTGSAHCSLAPYWAERLHKHEFFAWQASKRGGELKVTLRGDRVLLKGEAVTVMKGQFSI